MYTKLGILGGMGPLATYTFYKNIIANTPADCDQKHINMVILNASYIPDRTASILGSGGSSLPHLLAAVKELETSGCDLIAIPCNTAHYYFDDMQKHCKTRILNMLDLTAIRLTDENVKKVLLMGTEGTIKSGVYNKYLSSREIQLLTPADTETAEIMHVIYDVKAGKKPKTDMLKSIAKSYIISGCDKVILGCTELSVLEEKIAAAENLIDPMEVLQNEVLKLFGHTQV